MGEAGIDVGGDIGLRGEEASADGALEGIDRGLGEAIDKLASRGDAGVEGAEFDGRIGIGGFGDGLGGRLGEGSGGGRMAGLKETGGGGGGG